MVRRLSLLLLTFAVTSCTPAAPPPSAGPALEEIQPAQLTAHLKFLSHDLLEGRAPSTRGGDLAAEYLAAQLALSGFEPGAADGTYFQQVAVVESVVDPSFTLRVGSGAPFKYLQDVVAFSGVQDAKVSTDAEVIFVGHGIVAPEYKWNDYEGVDIKGKIALVMVNDPPAAADEPQLFAGPALTYYGRWTYKFEEAARKGAAGALIIHEAGPAGYPFNVVQGNLSEKFDLVTPDKNMGRANIEGWLSLDAAKRLLKMAGQDFDALKKQALTREFKPVPLGLKASLAVKNTMRTIESRNVLAKLDGSDPVLKDEYVVYTAHWDHFGIGEPKNGDKIYNGALDNASGVSSMLEIARELSEVKPAPRRSILFVAVTAEEQGLLGSLYYAVTPVYPLARTLANINIDGINPAGRTKDITVIGLGASDLDDYLRDAAAEQSRTLRPDPESEKGFYYRSDHFNFAKQGVPALYTDNGVEYIGKPSEFAMEIRDRYNKEDYHQPSDQVKPDWDLSGAVEDAELMAAVGYRVANADRFPEWKPGNEFRAKREEMLKR